MRFIDSLLNKVTMYRLTLYYLIALLVWAFILSVFGILHVNPLDIVIDAGLALSTCIIGNYILSKLFGAVTNVESAIITALILVLIVPLKFPVNATFFIGASIFAIGSKYFVTVEKRHLFNPAAAGVLALSLLSPEHTATWWVGTQSMLPVVLVGGLLLMRKIQRETLTFTFLISYALLLAAAAFLHGGTISAILTSWRLSILNSAVFFFTFVMLTEPLTSPTTKKRRQIYAYIVAFCYATPQLRLLSFAFTPEMALIIGNIYSFIVSPKFRLVLPLVWKKEIGSNTVVFGFESTKNFSFIPGQYMEWTLPHTHVDNRGNRRYFSLANSPTENEIMLMIKFYDPSSSFKKALLSMQEGQEIVATQVAGDFVLPKDPTTPIVFIAGGIGIAPFRSMIQHIIDNKLTYNIVIIYSNRKADEIAFADLFQKAEQYGVKTIYTLTDIKNIPQNWQGETGYITEKMIQNHIPDYSQRTFYLSGPQLMVEAYEDLLSKLHVPSSQVVKDYFPGY
ncbi:MAG TPA: FAD-binding oxidoreductase [Patescibacteria group bacterium]